MTKPLGIAVSTDGGRIYVTQSSGDQATLLLDAAGKPVAVLAPPAELTAHASQLYVAVNPVTGDVYATDRTAGAVNHYRADGTYVDQFDNGPTIDVWQPLAIAFDTTGNLYVSDVGGADQTVHVFGPDGALIRNLGSEGLFSFPNGIAVDKSGFVYVSDSNNGRLLVFDTTGTQVAIVKRGPGRASSACRAASPSMTPDGCTSSTRSGRGCRCTARSSRATRSRRSLPGSAGRERPMAPSSSPTESRSMAVVACT